MHAWPSKPHGRTGHYFAGLRLHHESCCIGVVIVEGQAGCFFQPQVEYVLAGDVFGEQYVSIFDELHLAHVDDSSDRICYRYIEDVAAVYEIISHKQNQGLRQRRGHVELPADFQGVTVFDEVLHVCGFQLLPCVLRASTHVELPPPLFYEWHGYKVSCCRAV